MRKILSFLSPLFVISLVYAANLPIEVHPAIVFSPNSVVFVPSPVGTPASGQAITVLNSGPVTVPIGSITITGTNSADFGQMNTCGASITSSASCTITISFTPTINAAETAQLNLNASGTPGHSYSISLTASGFVFSISSVSITPNTFPGGSADGTPVGAIGVNLTSRTTNNLGFTGTLALASTANFRLSSTTLPANLLLNGTQAAGSYTAGIIPTQAGLSNSGSTFNVPITGTAPGSSPTLTLNVSPSSPVISATTPLNTKIADLSAVWSDASTFSGTFNFVTPNFDSGGTYAALGNGLIISPSGPGVGGAGGTTENVSMQAVQGSTNSSTVTVPITITSISETVFDNGGSPWNFLNQINAVNYDQCGSGCAYVVINPVSCSSAELTYRSDCVNFKTYSSSPGFRLGFSLAGDLYKYTISVPQTGAYALNALLSDASSGGSWAVLIDGNQVATISTPNTGSYDTFSLAQSSSFALNAGTHVLGLRVNGGDVFNGAGDLVYVQGLHPSPPPPSGNNVCDQGPNTAAIPAPAQAAGFTHCALNADFATNTTDSNGTNWSNTASYLINCGAAASVPNQPSRWHFDYRIYGTEAALPCARTVITTDGAGGGNQALELILTTADYAGNLSGNPPQTNGYLSFPSRNVGISNTPWLPNELYTKVVYREDASSFNQGAVGPNIVYGADTWWSQNTVFDTYLDEDYAELVPFTPNSCSSISGSFYGKFWEGPISNLSSTVCSILPNNDFTQYHTLETLVTSNESTDLTLCEWLDGTFTGCTSPYGLTNNGGFAYTKHDRSVIMSNGVIPAVTSINNDLRIFIKSIEIWSCPNFATQTCPGTIVDHWPFP